MWWLRFSWGVIWRRSWHASYVFLESRRLSKWGNVGEDDAYIPTSQHPLTEGHKSPHRVPCCVPSGQLRLLHQLLYLLCWSTRNEDTMSLLQWSTQECQWSFSQNIHIFPNHPSSESVLQKPRNGPTHAIPFYFHPRTRHRQGYIRWRKLHTPQGRICNYWRCPAGTQILQQWPRYCTRSLFGWILSI